MPGFKYNMMDLQAAIGLHSSRASTSCTRGAKPSARATTPALADLPLRLPAARRAGTVHARHLYTRCCVDPRRRHVARRAAARLRDRGISTSIHFRAAAPAPAITRSASASAAACSRPPRPSPTRRCRCRCRAAMTDGRSTASSRHCMTSCADRCDASCCFGGGRTAPRLRSPGALPLAGARARRAPADRGARRTRAASRRLCARVRRGQRQRVDCCAARARRARRRRPGRGRRAPGCAARRAGCLVVTIHDLGLGCLDADLVIDGSITQTARARRGQTLAGPQYRGPRSGAIR